MKRISYSFFCCLLLGLFSCSGNKTADPTPTNTNTGSTGTTGGGTSLPSLAITSFSPANGKSGTLITITGTGFGSDVSAVQVAIGSSPYNHPVAVSATTIQIQTNLATPSGKISVIVNSTTVTSASDFTAIQPDLEVSGISPGNSSLYQYGSFQLGESMVMAGIGFGNDTSKINVSFGGTTPVHANYLALDGLAIAAIVPRYAQEGKVTVTVGGVSVTCNQTYTFSMSLRDYSPKFFRVGDTVKITGVKFTTVADMAIQFNDNKVTRPISVTPTEMRVTVPYTAKSGYLTVSAGLGTISDYTSDKFTVLP